MDQTQTDPGWWRHKAITAIHRNLDRGGDHAILARTDETIFKEHQPEPDRTGAPCKACGQEWPCGMFQAVLTPE